MARAETTSLSVKGHQDSCPVAEFGSELRPTAADLRGVRDTFAGRRMPVSCS